MALHLSHLPSPRVPRNLRSMRHHSPDTTRSRSHTASPPFASVSASSSSSSSSPSVILWDVLDTLVYDPFYQHMPAFFDMTFDELMARKHPTAWLDFERGVLDENQFAESFFKDGQTVDMQALKAHMNEQYKWIEGMDQLVGDVSASGNVQQHLLSNYPTWYEMIESKLALEKTHGLQWTFVSTRTGFRKPEAGAYEYALDALGCDASQVIFVDDRKANVEAAEQLGMRGVHFEDATSARAAIKSHGVDV
ncbi:uracil phosphatase [Pseudoscourfieldia marina]